MNIKKTGIIAFLEIGDPENRIGIKKINRLNSYLSTLLGKGSLYSVVKVPSSRIVKEYEGCSGYLPEDVLKSILDEKKAEKVYYGDILLSGEFEAILFLHSWTITPNGKNIKDSRQILLSFDESGSWNTEPYIRTPRSREEITIMLDPGHGGVDTGAEAVFHGVKLYEKELNNNLTRLLSVELKARGYQVLYTRSPDDDYFINTDGRSELINQKMPDFLVSIHHDFSELRKDSGFAVYYASFKPVIDINGAYLLVDGKKREYLSQYKARGKMIINFTDGNGKESSTREIPWWMDYDPFVRDDSPSREATESLKLAYLVYCNLIHNGFINPYHYTPGRIIEDRDYAILRDNKVPSILIETGFITNAADMTALTEDQYHNTFVISIADGLDTFFSISK